MKNAEFWMSCAEAPIVLFFVAMTIVGLSETLAGRGINPITIQIAGLFLMLIVAARSIHKVIDYWRGKNIDSESAL
ncbi:MAG: hypothetical protein O3A93_03385 [Chloroflexi bacterium]|nr:hypothetical protein [Chloroflexota bacterium]PKB59248.1 MAG: hypothetical protein BZY83_02910 [SAR202 cluster bacterium Casp-Chloro-G2]